MPSFLHPSVAPIRVHEGNFPSFVSGAPQTTKPPAGGLVAGEYSLPLRVLASTSRLVQADLLPLDFARVARHQSRLLQHGLERSVMLYQRARDAVPHRAGLA